MTDNPATDGVRQTLAARSDRWFSWLVISSIVVGFGVILEAPEATVELKRWYANWKYGKTDGWITPVSYLGLLLVVSGVAGEGIFEFLASKADTALRAHDEQILADTIKEAGTAKDSAHEAVKAAGLARSAANVALGKAETASIISDKAGRSARAALTIAGEAKADVITVQSNIAKVDEKYAPRTLSRTKRDLLIEILRNEPVKPKETVLVTVGADAPDGSAYADEIADAISDPTTGWKAKVDGLMTSDGRNKGVFLVVRNNASKPPWADGLLKALQWSGIVGVPASNESVPTGTAEILVERKD
jgi:hypothetical protein